MKFTELRRTGLPVAEENERVYRLFPTLVRSTHLHLWQPDDPVDPRRRLLVGAATWSLYDLSLLDVLNEAMRRAAPPVDRVDVFDVDGVTTGRDFESYIPGLVDVVDTPLAGFWAQGVLQNRAFGWRATQMASELFGIKLDWNRAEWRWDVRWLASPSGRTWPRQPMPVDPSYVADS